MKTREVDLTIFSDIEESDFYRVAQNHWERFASLSQLTVRISRSQHYQLTRHLAEKVNFGRSIFDKRTRGGKLLARAEENSSLNLVKVYETDFGTINLKIEDETS